MGDAMDCMVEAMDRMALQIGKLEDIQQDAAKDRRVVV